MSGAETEAFAPILIALAYTHHKSKVYKMKKKKNKYEIRKCVAIR